MKDFVRHCSKEADRFPLPKSYISGSVQKGGLAGVFRAHGSGQLIWEAQENKRNLPVVCDLASAYGSIQHKLGQTAMTRCHVADQVVGLIMDNYNQFGTRVSSSVTSDWRKLEAGIITGCTISMTIVTLAMNI